MPALGRADPLTVVLRDRQAPSPGRSAERATETPARPGPTHDHPQGRLRPRYHRAMLEFRMGPASDRTRLTEAEAIELQLLADQLRRMRGMLFAYSDLFFRTIRNWAFLVIILLVASTIEPFGAAVIPVPFIVPFAFLETGYLFYYAVFARRHAERLEQAINERFGHDVLVAHRLEAAYFYPPDRPKVAAFSLARPTGFMSAMTLGYSAGAAILWAAGMVGLAGWAADAGSDVAALLVPGALVWTAVIVLYLAWTFLVRPDERRFEAVLRDAYRRPPPPPPADGGAGERP